MPESACSASSGKPVILPRSILATVQLNVSSTRFMPGLRRCRAVPKGRGRGSDQRRRGGPPGFGREEPAIGAFEADRAQPAGGESAGIEADAVRPLDHAVADAVAVDDQLAELGVAVEEARADPAHVGALLVLDRHAGAQAGMDEDVIADLDPVLERFEESDVALRDVRLQQREQLGIIGAFEIMLGDAVAQDRLAAADPHEQAQRFHVAGERAEEDLLVIAEDEADVAARLGKPDQPIDHARRIGAAIDEIAEEDELRLRGAAGAVVRLDLPDQIVEQAEAAVDIADRIDALPFGDGARDRLAILAFAEKSQHRSRILYTLP